ncbi:MAG: TadE/TadG family type IV pilus assembly protein [Clostridiaceae bacterium]
MRILKNQKGQSLVEFAIILPLLLLIVMAIIEFGMMLNSYITIQSASREGARTAIVGSSNIEIQNLIVNTTPNLKASQLTINITPNESSRKSGEPLTVKLTYNYDLTVPIISSLFNNVIVLNAETTMRIE